MGDEGRRGESDGGNREEFTMGAIVFIFRRCTKFRPERVLREREILCKMEGKEFNWSWKGSREHANAKGRTTSLLDKEVKEEEDDVKQILDLKLENFDIESVLNKGIVLLSTEASGQRRERTGDEDGTAGTGE